MTLRQYSSEKNVLLHIQQLVVLQASIVGGS